MQTKEFKDFNDVLMIQNPKRTFKMHRIDRPGTIIPVAPHLQIKKKYNCLIESVSCGGALLNFSPFIELPQNFFLVMLGSTEEIGSTIVRREKDRMMIKFNMFLDPGFLQSIVSGASFEVEAT